MKKISLFVCTLFISVSALIAQSTDELKAQALTEAQASGDATLKWDLDGMMKYVHPKVFEVSGGKDQLVSQMGTVKKMMDDSGVAITGYKVIGVKELVQEQGEYRCLVATNVKMTMNGQKLDNQSHLFGFYIEDQKQWAFVEASQLKGPLKAQLFPDFKTSIVIPEDVMTPE